MSSNLLVNQRYLKVFSTLMLLFSYVKTTTWFEGALFFALWAPLLFVEHLKVILCNHCMKFLTKSTGLFCPKTGKLTTLIIISHLFENQKYLKVFNILMLRLLDKSVFLCVYNNIEDNFFQLQQHWAPLLFVKHFDTLKSLHQSIWQRVLAFLVNKQQHWQCSLVHYLTKKAH